MVFLWRSTSCWEFISKKKCQCCWCSFLKLKSLVYLSRSQSLTPTEFKLAADTMKNSIEVLPKRVAIWSSNPIPGHIFAENCDLKRYLCLVFFNDITNIVVKHILETHQCIALKNIMMCFQVQIVLHIYYSWLYCFIFLRTTVYLYVYHTNTISFIFFIVKLSCFWK